MIDYIGTIEEILDQGRKARGLSTRNKYYVDGTQGNDNYSGLSTHASFATIGAAITAASAGDLIHIAKGTYDEAVSIPAAQEGLQVFCEPGVVLSNTTPGTVVSIAAPYVDWRGGIVSQAGQISFAVTDKGFHGIDILVEAGSDAFDMDADHFLLENCRAMNFSGTGFDISEDQGVCIKCFAYGQAAARGFYLSHTNAHNNFFFQCHTINCTAAGYETVAGADENLFAFCTQSSLCAGPTDAGANNTWASHSQDSQITAGNTLQEDLAAIYDKDVAETTGTYSFDETNAAEQTAITQTITAKTKIGGIWLDMTNVTQDVTIRYKHQIDGTNYRTFYSHDWVVATDDDGVLFQPFTAYRNVRVTLQCGGGGGGSVNIPYAIV